MELKPKLLLTTMKSKQAEKLTNFRFPLLRDSLALSLSISLKNDILNNALVLKIPSWDGWERQQRPLRRLGVYHS